MASQNWQTLVTEFASKFDLIHSPTTHLLDLVSEVGEVSKEILLTTEYGQRELSLNEAQIADELGDVLYSLCLLATSTGVDLEDALRITLDKYETRMEDTGQPGSIER